MLRAKEIISMMALARRTAELMNEPTNELVSIGAHYDSDTGLYIPRVQLTAEEFFEQFDDRNYEYKEATFDGETYNWVEGWIQNVQFTASLHKFVEVPK